MDSVECSATCGGGEKVCKRTCENGDFGDDGCAEDEEIKEVTCNDHACRMEL